MSNERFVVSTVFGTILLVTILTISYNLYTEAAKRALTKELYMECLKASSENKTASKLWCNT